LKKIVHKFRLPLSFSFYPAQTWEHKNHLRLLEALALLRDRNGLEIHLVCTGKQNDFWRIIKKRVYELRLQNQVHFLGFVDATELRALYHLAQFVIHPSLFEGGGLPILEGFREGAPVACSNVTSLPEYAGDAALYFDPTSVESIADALCRMTTDVDLRESLRQRGVARVRQFTWERTAKTYRALYRKVAGKKLSDEDRDLLKETT
jgi:glycosyltransferase involved in cell wall biosynthesis